MLLRSVEIECDEIVFQYVRFDIGEDPLNVVRVDGRCEMVVNSSFPISLDAQKHGQNELVNVLDRSRIALELWIVGADVALGGEDFRFEQIGFVQKQNYRNAGECGIIDDRIENVLRLFEPICCAANIKQMQINRRTHLIKVNFGLPIFS